MTEDVDVSDGPESVRAGFCRRSDCPIASGGDPCALGHEDPLDCPEYEPESDEENELEHDQLDAGDPYATEATASSNVPGRRLLASTGAPRILAPGVDLTGREAALLLCDRPAFLVVPVGEVKVGKTTLIASLYEHLCRGPVAGWAFAGSETLLAFEDRCFWAMPSSGRSEADMPHTRYGYAGFLHLRLCNRDPSTTECRDLLLAEVSGEHLKEFTRQNEPGELEGPLRSADVVILLVSGEHLSDPSRRWAAIGNARTALRTCEERLSVSDHATVLVAVTKWDYCEAVDEIGDVIDRLQDEVEGIVPATEILRTAARPNPESAVPEGFGVDELLERILRVPRVRAGRRGQSLDRHSDSHFRAGAPLLAQLARAAREMP